MYREVEVHKYTFEMYHLCLDNLGFGGTSANWFDEIMTCHDMSPKVTMLNLKVFGDLWRFNMVTFDDI